MLRARPSHCCVALFKDRLERQRPGRTATPNLNRLCDKWQPARHRSAVTLASASRRRAGSGDLSPEASLQAALEADALIDELLPLSDGEIANKVGPRLLSYDQGFYLRIATRVDIAEDEETRENLVRVSNVVMKTMDSLARKSQVGMCIVRYEAAQSFWRELQFANCTCVCVSDTAEKHGLIQHKLAALGRSSCRAADR